MGQYTAVFVEGHGVIRIQHWGWSDVYRLPNGNLWVSPIIYDKYGAANCGPIYNRIKGRKLGVIRQKKRQVVREPD